MFNAEPVLNLEIGESLRLFVDVGSVRRMCAGFIVFDTASPYGKKTGGGRMTLVILHTELSILGIIIELRSCAHTLLLV